MQIIFKPGTGLAEIESAILALKENGYGTAILFYAEGGLGDITDLKQSWDILLKTVARKGIQVFGGIFPAIIDNGRLHPKGSMVIGIQSRVHIITLEHLEKQDIGHTILQQLPARSPGKEWFKTLFVIGDGFGEANHNLIAGVTQVVAKHPLQVVGGLAGRDHLKTSHFNIFTPEKIIQNGAVLAFSDVLSSIGVNHGWTPIKDSECTITCTNYCYVETIDNKPALSVYLDLISRIDPRIARRKSALMAGDANLVFKEVAIQYPLGLVRGQGKDKAYIDRTPVSVGADRSLQFSAQIPEGTRVCILQLTGKSSQAQCLNMQQAALAAYLESARSFPETTLSPRTLIMDCFGRRQMVDNLGYDYERVEFDLIAKKQEKKAHSPAGVLTFGEISSTPRGDVELHNKTCVVATLEDN